MKEKDIDREKKRKRHTSSKKWKFIETVIQSGGFAHSTRMLFGLRQIESTRKFYTNYAIAFTVLSSF